MRAPRASVLLCVLLLLFLFSTTVSPVFSSPTAPTSCAITPDKLDGQGLSVTQLGLSVTQLGLSVTQLGLSVTQLGLSVTQLGLSVTQLGTTPEQIVIDLTHNIITPAWLTDLLPAVQGGAGFNGTPTAVLIVDDFSSPTAHGADVRKVFTDLLAALDAADDGQVNNSPNITLHNVDISIEAIGFESTAIAEAIRAKVDELDETYQHFVINMSFGLLPCASTTDVTLTDSESGATFRVTADFSYDAFEAARDQALSPASMNKRVSPVLECVVVNSNGTRTAYFGYNNLNSVAVTIPVGTNNRFHPLPQNRNQPTVFAPGRQRFVFSVDYSGTNLVWILKGPDGKGRTATAGSNNAAQECARRGITPPPPGTLTLAPTGYGISQYVNQVLGVPVNFVDEYLSHLASEASEDPINGLQALLRGYLQASYDAMTDGDPDTIFAVIPVASSGNFRHIFGDTPLKPSLFPENIASSATLGDFGSRWVLSHSGNILAPGAAYPFEYNSEGKITRLGAGTSFSAPFLSIYSALWLTYPNACTFGDGLPPLSSHADEKDDDATARANQPNPLNCTRPGEPEPQADLALTKSDSPDPATAGESITYTLTVINYGPDTAENVSVTDTLPEGVVPASVSASQGACEDTTCELGSLASDSSATIEIVVTAPNVSETATIANTAHVASTTPDPDPENNSASADTTVEPLRADLWLTKSDSPDPVTAGGQIIYTLTVNNSGPDTATNVTLIDTLPGGVSLVSSSTSQGTCDGSTCALGDLAAGGSASVTFVVTAPAAEGTITNLARVTSDTTDPLLENNGAFADTTVQVVQSVSSVLECVADLGDGSYRAYFGYLNPNSFPVTIEIGPRNEFVPGSNLGQPTTFAPGRQVDVFSVVFNGEPLVWKLDGGTSTASSNPAQRCADVGVTKTGQAEAAVGEYVEYVITVTNHSPRAVHNIVVTDPTPDNARAISSAPICTFENNIKTCTVGTLEGGQSYSFGITVEPLAAGTLVNTATVSSDEGAKGNPANNSASVTTTIYEPYEGDAEGAEAATEEAPASE